MFCSMFGWVLQKSDFSGCGCVVRTLGGKIWCQGGWWLMLGFALDWSILCWWLVVGLIHSLLISNCAASLPGLQDKPTVDAHYKSKSCFRIAGGQQRKEQTNCGWEKGSPSNPSNCNCLKSIQRTLTHHLNDNQLRRWVIVWEVAWQSEPISCDCVTCRNCRWRRTNG